MDGGKSCWKADPKHRNILPDEWGIGQCSGALEQAMADSAGLRRPQRASGKAARSRWGADAPVGRPWQ